MPLPSIDFGVTVKQLVVLVTLGSAAAYLINAHDDIPAENLAQEAFIRAQEQVNAQIGTVLEIAMVRQVVAHPGYSTLGYTRSMYAVDGERGRLMVTLKRIEGESTIEVTQIRRP
ncbi:hypothetical protein DYL59_05595 [Pseudomonas kairouanensis]|uniref:Uncharacterized protein n=1 Tax=Pseudomonas kairouanensis TaxID=2293832 RepID=A0A4Z0AYL2_9PSED|nr:hypothetical protein [Pseudomonas kairouanensis]TFY91427.1 hypothetical protein DYL59_05595 [Pseudomonas kairouanensis]